jgi:hypothetical protein
MKGAAFIRAPGKGRRSDSKVSKTRRRNKAEK